MGPSVLFIFAGITVKGRIVIPQNLADIVTAALKVSRFLSLTLLSLTLDALLLVTFSFLFIFLCALLTALLGHILKVLEGRITLHSRKELSVVHSLILEKELCNEMKLVDMLVQYVLCDLISIFNDSLDLLVDNSRSLLGIVTAAAEITAEEYFVVFRAVKDGTELLTHTKLSYHIACNIGGTLNIVGCTAGNITEDDALSRSARKEH